MLYHKSAFLLLLRLCLVFLFMMLTVVNFASASDPTSFHIRPLNATTSELVAKNLAVDTGSLPIVAWDVYASFDHAKGHLASVSPGPAWQALDCGFVIHVVDGTDPFDANDVFLSGFCTNRIENGVRGEEIVLATLTWQDCRSGFVVDLRSRHAERKNPLTDVVDVSLQSEQYVPDADLFDGGACGDTTQGIQTTIDNPLPQASPLATSAPILALVVGGVILAAAAAAAFLRLRRS
ncbi:hypothetical protein [Candidatus Amarolinea aalborgensis]|jgi:hypothetical protein|uniref:hypothetical protein n=1 Tax=Candidatus Amarolinea aalborgensis TaxID=2249329 RepID=UPI003BFA0265